MKRLFIRLMPDDLLEIKYSGNKYLGKKFVPSKYYSAAIDKTVDKMKIDGSKIDYQKALFLINDYFAHNLEKKDLGFLKFSVFGVCSCNYTVLNYIKEYKLLLMKNAPDEILDKMEKNIEEGLKTVPKVKKNKTTNLYNYLYLSRDKKR